MAQDMRRDGLVLEGGTVPSGLLRMLLEQIGEAGTCHGSTLVTDEEFGHCDLATDGQPRPDILGGLLPERQGPMPTAFALDVERRSRLPSQCCQRQREQFRHPQASGEAYMHHGPVPEAGTRVNIRRIEDGLHLGY